MDQVEWLNQDMVMVTLIVSTLFKDIIQECLFIDLILESDDLTDQDQ